MTIEEEVNFLRAKTAELERQLAAQGSQSYLEVQKTCTVLIRKNTELRKELSKLVDETQKKCKIVNS